MYVYISGKIRIGDLFNRIKAMDKVFLKSGIKTYNFFKKRKKIEKYLYKKTQ